MSNKSVGFRLEFQGAQSTVDQLLDVSIAMDKINTKLRELKKGGGFEKNIDEVRKLKLEQRALQEQTKELRKEQQQLIDAFKASQRPKDTSVEDAKKAALDQKRIIEEQKQSAREAAAEQKRLKEEARAQDKRNAAEQKKAIQEARLEQKRLLEEAKQAQMDRPYNKLNRELVELRKKIQDIRALGGVVSKEDVKRVNELDRTLKKIDTSVGLNHRYVGDYRGAIKQGVQGAGGAVTGGLLMGGAVGVGAAVGGAALAQWKKAADLVNGFEQAIADMSAVAGDASDDELESLKQNAIDVGARSSFTATQVAELQTELSKLGFSTSEILNLTESVVLLSRALGGPANETAALLGATLNGFGGEAYEAAQYAEVLAAAANKSALDFDDFKIALPRVSAAAKAMGLTLADVSAQLGILRDNGLRAENAGVSLRNIFLLSAKAGKDWEEQLREIRLSTNQLGKATELFGSENAITALTLANSTQELAKMKAEISGTNDELEKMAEKRLATVRGQIELTEGAWESFILSIQDGDGVMSNFFRNQIKGIGDFLEVLTAANNGQIHWFDTAAALVGSAQNKLARASQTGGLSLFWGGEADIFGTHFGKDIGSLADEMEEGNKKIKEQGEKTIDIWAAIDKGITEFRKGSTSNFSQWYKDMVDKSNEGVFDTSTEGGIKDKIKQLKEQLDTLKIGSEQYKKVAKEIRGLEKSIGVGKKEKDQGVYGSIDYYKNILKNFEEQLPLLNRKSKAYDQLRGNVDKYKAIVEELQKTENEYFDAQDERRRRAKDPENNTPTEGFSNIHETPWALLSQEVTGESQEAIEKRGKATFDARKKAEDAVIKLATERNEARLKKNAELIEIEKDLIKALKEVAFDLATGFADIAFSAEMDRIDKQKEARLGALEEEYARKYELAAGDAELQKRLDKEQAAEKRKIEKEAFEQNKKAAIGQAIISGLLAIAKSWVTPGYPANLPLLPYLAGQTVLQVAGIAAQKFAKGGKVKRLPPGLITASPNVNPTPEGDNVLALVKPGETVLTPNQVDKLGGADAMRKIGVPGYSGGGRPISYFYPGHRIPKYNEGGYVGQYDFRVAPDALISTNGMPANASATFSNDQIIMMADIIAQSVANQLAPLVGLFYQATKEGTFQGLNEDKRLKEREASANQNSNF